MIWTAISQHDSFNQCSPPQIVDMIERRTSVDQTPHHLGMPEVRRGNKRGAEIWACH